MEYYAKITTVDKGMFRCAAVIIRSENKIDRVLYSRKFLRYNSARKWAEKKIFTATLESSNKVFIREQDLTRKVFQ